MSARCELFHNSFSVTPDAESLHPSGWNGPDTIQSIRLLRASIIIGAKLIYSYCKTGSPCAAFRAPSSPGWVRLRDERVSAEIQLSLVIDIYFNIFPDMPCPETLRGRFPHLVYE
jgi:hypothetical protein